MKSNTAKKSVKKTVKVSKPKIQKVKKIVLARNYRPNAKEEYMNEMQLEYFRLKLVEWRDQLLKESRETIDHLREENWHNPDMTDRASIEAEATVELRTRNRYLKLIAKIDSALRRIEEGDYGYCEVTGDEIGIKRLEARPIATMTVEAQEMHEREEKQYNEDSHD